jgi:hypothetical protein
LHPSRWDYIFEFGAEYNDVTELGAVSHADAENYTACCFLHADILCGLLFNPEDGGDIVLQYVH